MAGIDTHAERLERRGSVPNNRRREDVASSPSWTEVRHQYHPHCVACDPRRRHGLRLEFVPAPDGWIEAAITIGRQWEGYAGICHGGVVATVLDSAMTNCLFARGLIAVTAAMEVRYQQPVPAEVPLLVRARMTGDRRRLYTVEAVLLSGRTALAKATGKFIPLRHV